MKINIPIPKRNTKCAEGGEPFNDGDSYVSYLEVKETACERKDYCIRCWSQQAKGSRHSWKGKIPVQIPKTMSAHAKSLTLFKSFLESQENPKLLYVLTQLLVRKKVLFKLKNEYYELASTGEVFHIKTFILKVNETELLAAKIADLFHE